MRMSNTAEAALWAHYFNNAAVDRPACRAAAVHFFPLNTNAPARKHAGHEQHRRPCTHRHRAQAGQPR